MMKLMNLFENKKILITGGTGSFGNEMTKSLLKYNLKEIRIFSRDEKKQFDMREKYKDHKVLNFIIGDIRDNQSVYNATKDIDLIFHSAALKQVPTCEFFPLEAVKTNILGTHNLLFNARLNNVKKVVVLSTDKAVYPINAMGISKALMEKVMISESSKNPKGIVFCATRYGNVLGSRGSVLPLFLDQINNKSVNSLTVTDKKMSRFIMTLQDSVDLVIKAFSDGKNGDIFVKKQPACNIVDMAQALLELKNSKKKIRFIGVRNGEKNYESLISTEESIRTIENKNFFLIKPDYTNLNYDNYFSKGSINHRVFEYNSTNTNQLNIQQIKKLLLKSNLI